MQTRTGEIHIFHRTRCIQPIHEIGQPLRVLGLDSLFDSVKEKFLQPFVRKGSNHLLMCNPSGYACQERQAKPLLAVRLPIIPSRKKRLPCLPALEP